MTDIQTDLNCPDCGRKLILDLGSPGNFWEPGEPATIYCAKCGYDRQPTSKEIDKYVGKYNVPNHPYPHFDPDDFELDEIHEQLYNDLPFVERE